MPIPGMTGGDGTPIVKYNAKGAKWKVDDVTLNGISFAIALDNCEAGWALFRENSAPHFVMVPAMDLAGGKPYPAQPSEDHRKGFRVMVKLPDKLAGGKPSIREFASCSLAVRRAFDNLYDTWILERKNYPGQVPAVTVKDYEEVPSKHGSNFAPIFKITRWVDRPADLNGKGMASDEAVPAHVDVPGEPEAVGDDDNDVIDY